MSHIFLTILRKNLNWNTITLIFTLSLHQGTCDVSHHLNVSQAPEINWNTKHYKTRSPRKQTPSLSATRQPGLLKSQHRNRNPSVSSPPWAFPEPLWPKWRCWFPWSWCHQHGRRKSNEELSTVNVPCEHGFAPAPALLLMSLTRLTMILQKLWEPLAVQHLSNTSKVSKVWHKQCLLRALAKQTLSGFVPWL